MMLGVGINFAAVIAGSFTGLLLKQGIPEEISQDIQKALGLCVIFIGVTSMLKGSDVLVLILSMLIGSIIGSCLDLDKRLNDLCRGIEKKLQKTGLFVKFKGESLSAGFITASLTFCIGAMTVTGALQAGLENEHSIYIAKAIIDGVTACLFTVSMGIGVIFSAVAILVVQGSLVLLASVLGQFLTNEAMIAEIISCGGLLILAISINMMNIGKVKVANYLPALIVVPFMYSFVQILPL